MVYKHNMHNTGSTWFLDTKEELASSASRLVGASFPKYSLNLRTL